ncbi:MAG TPA: DUF305 domain-containing protein [Lysobacter sp.]|nr:DUF305 domain-containing protein [Lysobacter sp.]
MALVSYALMYALMYGMVDGWSGVYLNLNQAYMAGLMAAPMVALELLLMKRMYGNARLNTVLIVLSLAATVLFWALLRTQAAIGDAQFLRSMIPHHSGALLMCREARLSDPRLQALCRDIQAGQQREIELMRALLAERGG